jgi:selenide,water dikinase
MTPETEPIRLTQFAKATGCSCKIAPAVLQGILAQSGIQAPFENLLVGNDHADDAAVYRMDNGTALIATADFFTPIVDDAFDYGRIAAANALSDVYAMGGKPVMALALLGWPDALSATLAGEVLRGAKAVCAEAGIPLAGGHSIITAEPVFGLSVNGIVSEAHLKKNSSAQEGDLLLLTKPIGAGIMTTARKRGQLEEADYPVLLESLTKLNAVGAKLGALEGITAMTDVTGFGLGGHLTEIAKGSGLSAELTWAAVPLMEGAKKYALQGIAPDAAFRNWNAISATTLTAPGVDVMEAFRFLPDPQTNGGLLITVRPDALAELQAILTQNGYDGYTAPIGRMTAQEEKLLRVV